MVKAYLRYEERAAFGVVASSEANICYDATGKLILSGALEQFVVWNVKQGRCIHTLCSPAPESGPRPVVTTITCMPSSTSLVAVGYSNGTIRIWDIVKGVSETTLNGHKGAVTALRYNKAGSLLASGSKDTDMIVWDVVGESGLFRLNGHRDQVTDVVFLEKGRRLVSCSKDTFVKVWDLDTQSCIQTVVGHRGEVWSLDVEPSECYLVTGSADTELRMYAIKEQEEHLTSKKKLEVLHYMGDIKRQSTDRVVTLRFNEVGDILGCQGAGKTVELYTFLDDANALKKWKRRKRRKREKAAKDVANGNAKVVEELENVHEDVLAADHIQLLHVLRVKHKIRSFAFSQAHKKKTVLVTIALSLHDNTLEVYEAEKEASSRIHSIDLLGHRSDVRAAVLSLDNSLLMTTSHNTVKLWNPWTCACLRTMDSGYGLCGLIVPGNRHAVVGTKAGTLEIFDISASEKLQELEAHSGAVWSLAPFPDGSGFISGSADHDVKFWDYEVLQDNNGSKRFSIRNVRTLRMTEDVLAVRLSSDSKYLAIALLDSTVKVFFTDTLKFFLSLYGHKLPVLCMDISSDGALLVSGSADKNIKIWGLDFGDCHKSLFAHRDSVMAVQFVPNTHYIFTVGKDHLVKYWDGDKFELLLTLEGHHAEVWCLAVSSRGDFVVTGSHDRSIRRWERTDEPFFIEEEKEKRLESLFDSGLDDGAVAPKDGEPEGGASLAGRKTIESVTAADSIIEALDMAEEENLRLMQHKDQEAKQEGKSLRFQPNPMLLGRAPSAYVFHAISSVRASELEQALMMLPFTDAMKVLGYIRDWIVENNQVELSCRVLNFLLRIHHHQLIASPSVRSMLLSLHAAVHPAIQRLKGTMGFNLAAMGHIQQLLATNSTVLFKDAGTKLLGIRAKLSNPTGHVTKRKRKQKPDFAA